MFQLCPVCKGSGIDTVSAFTTDDLECPICKGAKIINESTGLAPELKMKEIHEQELKQESCADCELSVKYSQTFCDVCGKRLKL